MKYVLIVEDSKMLAALLSRRIRSDLNFERDIAASLKEAQELIEAYPDRYFVAVVDLYLPDAPKGEVVDLVLSKGIPVIVFTGQFSDEIRETMMSKNVVDYIVKEGGPQIIDYLVSSVERFYKNQFSKILVVDDSRTSRLKLKQILEAHKFLVIEASNGQDALRILDENPDTKVVITDYNMPGMNGFDLVIQIRLKYPKKKLAIIGMSAYGTNLLSVRFLKNGASDFLPKPFLEEELFCRINQNIEMLEHLETIDSISNMDYLTGIFNRGYLFRVGQKLFENARRDNIHLTVGMIDIDHLSRVNDKFGFEFGDLAIKETGQLLTRNFRAADVVTRFGSDKFCIIAANMNPDYTKTVFERSRSVLEQKKMKLDGNLVSITVSIGVVTTIGESLEAMIKKAETLCSQAKEKGGNCVCVEE